MCISETGEIRRLGVRLLLAFGLSLLAIGPVHAQYRYGARPVEATATTGQTAPEPGLGETDQPVEAGPQEETPTTAGWWRWLKLLLVLLAVAAIPCGIWQRRRVAAGWEQAWAWYPLGQTIPAWLQVLLGVLGLVLVLIVWTLLTRGPVEQRRISIMILPSPWEVFASFPALWVDRQLPQAVYMSLRRVVLGFLLSALVAYPLGILMGTNQAIKALFQYLTSLGRFIPIAALVPITLMVFGTGEKQKVVFLFIGIVVYLLPLVVETVERVPREILQTAQTLGVRGGNLIFKVIVPYCLPELFIHGIIMFGIGWTYIILAEIIGAKAGLGNIITIAQRRSNMEQVYSTLLVIMAIGLVIDVGLKQLKQVVWRWDRSGGDV